jgi:hypothetical protein
MLGGLDEHDVPPGGGRREHAAYIEKANRAQRAAARILLLRETL